MDYLVDTHCHIHDPEFSFDQTHVFQSAHEANVKQMVCIGTSGENSQRAVDYVRDKQGVWASVGLHPHDAKMGEDDLEIIARLSATELKVVAIGEFGLDYHYNNSPRADQIRALEYQLQLAQSFNKPCIFHVREAFDDFWAVLDNFSGIRGVIHSFSATKIEVDRALSHDLLMGINGIMTFTKDDAQRDAACYIPIDRLVLETDAPFLTPAPLRGTMNVPANVRLVAACLAEMRVETLDQLIEATTKNAQTLFSLDSSELINF
jgi:TatD DNase family protein